MEMRQNGNFCPWMALPHERLLVLKSEITGGLLEDPKGTTTHRHPAVPTDYFGWFSWGLMRGGSSVVGDPSCNVARWCQ
jgi:hypothetical protein